MGTSQHKHWSLQYFYAYYGIACGTKKACDGCADMLLWIVIQMHLSVENLKMCLFVVM